MELPKGWTITSVGEIAQYINGRAFKPQEWEEKGLPIIRIQNLNNDKIKYNYTTKIYEDKYKVEYGDLLFAWSASLGAYIWRSSDAWLNQHIFKVIPFEGVDRKFMFYVLTNTVEHFYSKTHGSGMVHITKSIFEDTQILLPPFPEQQRIVEKIDALFSELDKGVEILQIVKEQLKTYRQSVFKSAFEGRLPEISNIYFSTRNIVDFFEVSGGLTKNSKRDKFSLKMPYLRVANVYFNFLDLDDIKSIGVTESEVERTLLFPGDLLFVEGNGSKEQIGRVAIWNGELDKCLHQNHIIKGRPNGLMNVKYALYYLMSKNGRDQILTIASSTSGLYTLSINKIKSLVLPFCSEQQKVIEAIESRLSVCDKLEQLVDENLAKADALRQSILKKAFEGRLVPQDPNDEPAETLLERIKAERAAAEQRKKRQKSVKRSKENG